MSRSPRVGPSILEARVIESKVPLRGRGARVRQRSERGRTISGKRRPSSLQERNNFPSYRRLRDMYLCDSRDSPATLLVPNRLELDVRSVESRDEKKFNFKQQEFAFFKLINCKRCNRNFDGAFTKCGIPSRATEREKTNYI